MAHHVDADTLQQWLTNGQAVTVVDIRTQEDRALWSIPGSIHIDAYDALRQGSQGALADAHFPLDTPVVTICNLGRVSETAAAALSERGYDARSLEGGMKAWSLAWNTAEVRVANNATRVIQLRRTGKGCLSYLVGSKGQAVVIDASLPPEVYLIIAAEHGLRIHFVLDTHIHADHLSRARGLAEKAGATLLLPPQDRVRFPFTPIGQGNSITFGEAALTAVKTPGHTLESMSYLLNGEALFTGDTLFLSGVGRPDLHADAGAAAERSRLLYHSIKGLLALGPAVLILPAHAAEPVAFDKNPLVARVSVVAERLRPWLTSEEAFVEQILKRLPPTPANYARIVEWNEAGVLPTGDPTDLEAGANRCAVT